VGVRSRRVRREFVRHAVGRLDVLGDFHDQVAGFCLLDRRGPLLDVFFANFHRKTPKRYARRWRKSLRAIAARDCRPNRTARPTREMSLVIEIGPRNMASARLWSIRARGDEGGLRHESREQLQALGLALSRVRADEARGADDDSPSQVHGRRRVLGRTSSRRRPRRERRRTGPYVPGTAHFHGGRERRHRNPVQFLLWRSFAEVQSGQRCFCNRSP
jgi:hypothetical protein